MSNNFSGTGENPVPYTEPQAGLGIPANMRDIYQWESMIEEIPRVNSMNGPFYMREFLKAKEVTSSYYCKLMYQYEQAKNKTKIEFALSYLERSQGYIKANGLKDTDETKKQYVQIDAAYNAAKDNEDMLKALVTLMGNKVDKFQSAHDDVKKIFDSARDPRGSLPSIPSGKDAQ